MKKISVLGTGWLGLPLCEHLIQQGFTVKGSTRSSTRSELLAQKGIAPFIIDLANEHWGEDHFFDADILIINIPFKDVSAFAHLIRKIEKSTVSNVIFISSTSVYGNQPYPISEQDHDALVPCALLEIEQLFNANAHFSTTVIRFAGLIGYHRNPALFFKNNRAVQNPDASVNMIHRDDCINIIDLIIKRDAWGNIYNACADTHPNKRDFYTYAAKHTGCPVPRFSDNNAPGQKIITNHKVKKDLGYEFIYPDLLNFQLFPPTHKTT